MRLTEEVSQGIEANHLQIEVHVEAIQEATHATEVEPSSQTEPNTNTVVYD